MGSLANCGKGLTKSERKDLEQRMISYINNEKMTGRDPMLFSVQDIIKEHSSALDSHVKVAREHLSKLAAPATEQAAEPIMPVVAAPVVEVRPETGSIEHFDSVMSGNELGQIIESPKMPETMAHLFEVLTTNLGFKSNTVLMTASDLHNTQLGQHVQAIFKQKFNKTPDQVKGGKFLPNLVDPKTGKIFHVAIVNDSMMGSTTMAHLVGMHEALGHGIYYELFNSAPQETKDAINADFDKFFKQVEMWDMLDQANKIEVSKLFVESGLYLQMGKDEAVRMLDGYIKSSQANNTFRLTMEKEWFANNMARAVLSHQRTHTLLGKFWAEFSTRIKKMYAIFKKDNVDLVTGVKSLEDYVSFLFKDGAIQQLEQTDTSGHNAPVDRSKFGVENFNTKLIGRHRSLINSVLDSMLQVSETGQISIKPEWLVQELVDGKLILSLRKVAKNYSSLAGEYSAKKIDGNWSVVWNGTVNGVKTQEVLFSLPQDKLPNIKGTGKSNTSWMVIKNVRDMMILADSAMTQRAPSDKPKVNLVDGFLQTAEGKAIKVRVPDINERLMTIYQEAVLKAAETGESSAQMFLKIMTGSVSLLTKNPGMKALEGSMEIASDEQIAKLERGIGIVQKLGGIEKLTELASAPVIADVASPEEAAIDLGLASIAREERVLPSVQVNNETKFADTKVAELVSAKQAIKRRKAEGPLTLSEIVRYVTERYEDASGKDFNELATPIQNYVSAIAGQMASEITGEALVEAKKARNDQEYLDAIKATESGVEFSMGDDLAIGDEVFPDITLGEFTTENGTHFLKTISVDGQVVGSVELVKKAKTWRISNIEIEESERGKKVAQASYLELASLAKAEGKVLKSDMKNGYMSTDAVRAWRALARKGLAVEGRNSFKVINVPNFGLTDQAANALVTSMYERGDDFAYTPKRKKSSRRTIRQTGTYADILNTNPKVKKVRQKKAIDPVKAQSKRDKLIKFIEDMTVQKNLADKKGISLFEQLKQIGFDNKMARIAVGSYNSNVSRFSQTEIIFRLANHLGLINEDGQSALETLIKTIFKPLPKIGVNDKGENVVEIEEGSDGTVASLGTAAKDILISRLQALVVANKDSYNYEDEQTLQQRKSELIEAEQGQSSFKWIKNILHWIQSNGEEQLSTTVVGRELIFRLKKFAWRATDYQRDYLFQLNEIGQAYRTETQRDYLYSLLTGENQPKNQMEIDFVSLIQQINVSYSREMEVLGVKIQYKNGRLEAYKHNTASAIMYFPHMWEPGTFEKKNEQMIQSLIDSGEAANRQHALNLMKQFRNDYIRSQKFANIERARETDLGGWMTDPIKVYQKYVTNTSRRLAQLREFGSTPELALAQFAIKHFKEGNDSEGLQKARDLINATIGVRVEEALMKEPKWGMTAGIMYSTGLLLQHAGFVQPGTATNMAMVGGMKNLAKSLVPGIKLYLNRRSPAYQKQWLDVVGALAFTMNKELYDIVLDDATREKSDKILRTFGVTQIDSMMRIVGALTGKLYAVELASDLASGKDNPKQRALLKRIGLDPTSILNRETPGVLTERELRLAGLAFAEETNFVTNPLSTPTILKNHPIGRIFFLFSRFAFQQHHLWKTVIKDSKGKALKGVLAGFTVGTPMMLLKMLLLGDDPEKVLERDGVAKMLWKAFCTGSGPGLFFESIGNALMQSSGKQTGNSGFKGLSVDSPAFGLAETMAKGLYSGAKITYESTFGDGDYTDSDVNKAGKGAVALAQLALIKTNNLAANAAVGFTRPLAERLLYPTENQKKGTYLRGE